VLGAVDDDVVGVQVAVSDRRLMTVKNEKCSRNTKADEQCVLIRHVSDDERRCTRCVMRCAYLRVQAVQGQLRQGNAWRVRGDHTAQALHVYHTVRVRYVRVQYRRQGVDHGAGLSGAARHVSFNGREVFEDGGLRADRAQEHAGVCASTCDSGTNRCSN
jgi:hypothetical protein